MKVLLIFLPPPIPLPGSVPQNLSTLMPGLPLSKASVKPFCTLQASRPGGFTTGLENRCQGVEISGDTLGFGWFVSFCKVFSHVWTHNARGTFFFFRPFNYSHSFYKETSKSLWCAFHLLKVLLVKIGVFPAGHFPWLSVSVPMTETTPGLICKRSLPFGELCASAKVVRHLTASYSWGSQIS